MALESGETNAQIAEKHEKQEITAKSKIFHKNGRCLRYIET
jgi:hypothetical protein